LKKQKDSCNGEEINIDITCSLCEQAPKDRDRSPILLLQLHQKHMAVLYFEEKVGFLSRLKIDMESWVGLFLFYKRNVFFLFC
jgi:hypothetical protein